MVDNKAVSKFTSFMNTNGNKLFHFILILFKFHLYLNFI